MTSNHREEREATWPEMPSDTAREARRLQEIVAKGWLPLLLPSTCLSEGRRLQFCRGYRSKDQHISILQRGNVPRVYA
jgi:hypothetical protein